MSPKRTSQRTTEKPIKDRGGSFDLPPLSLLVSCFQSVIEEISLSHFSYESLEECLKREGYQISQSFLKKLVPDIPSVISASLYQLTLAFEEAYKPQNGTIHEILFDGVMAYFDQVEVNKAFFSNIFRYSAMHPRSGEIALQHFCRVVRHLLLRCPSQKNLTEKLAVGVMLYVIPTWMEDETLDQSKTMAALDQSLRQVLSFFPAA